jgi:hypothetical protein
VKGGKELDKINDSKQDKKLNLSKKEKDKMQDLLLST